MKLTKTLHRFKNQLVSQIPGDAYLKSLPSFGLFVIAAALIWIAAPHITINEQTPFASVEKRSYITAFLFLIWILKCLMFDLDGPNPFQYKDLHTRKKLYSLQKRVLGVVSFLKKTTISRSGKTISLTELPWYLLIGPNDAGKTSLLANADVHYVLQRQLKPNEDPENLKPSEQCDWWVTKDACLVDVPGKYISLPSNQHQATNHGIFWRFFLQVIKKQRGKHGVNGIILALPLAEMMKEGNSKRQQASFQHLLSRIYELQRQFSGPIPCYLVITKCDLLSGFAEFFAEAGKEEINQPWGFSLPASKNPSKLDMLCVQRFNALIKKINQQLLWRLHQERNPMARPYIKDFPLQIEKLKEFTLDFIKKLSSANALPALQGVYLTSALQVKPESVILEEAVNNSQRAIQLFKPPVTESKSYFIKQFMMHALNDHPAEDSASPSRFKRYAIYALATSAVAVAGIFLGSDFKQGVNQTYAIENQIADYQAAVQHISNPIDHLSKTIDLLNALQPEIKTQPNEFKLTQLLAFYSTKSQKRNARVYQDALKDILLPEVKNYLAHYIVIPVNRHADNVYATLKAYIMLGDTNHFQANYIIDTFNFILPNGTNPVLKQNLADHLHNALYSNWTPMPLNMTLIQDTRNYLTALPAHQLGEVILKNINDNGLASDINFGLSDNHIGLIAKQPVRIANMFTAKLFNTVLSQETTTAADETTIGNWVLGDDGNPNTNPELTNALIEQLKGNYLDTYIDTWEKAASDITVATPKTLEEARAIILELSSQHSPLITFLQTVHDNTYFEPIASSSPKLQGMGALIEKNNGADALLYQLIASLQTSAQYLQHILEADNQKRAAFNAVSARTSKRGDDPLLALRLLAEKSPEPVRAWLQNLSNQTWRLLMQEAGRYMDTSLNTAHKSYPTLANNTKYALPTKTTAVTS